MTRITKETAVELARQHMGEYLWLLFEQHEEYEGEAASAQALCQAAIDWAAKQGEAVAWWLTNGEVTTSKSIADVHDYRNHDKAVPLYRHPAPVNQVNAKLVEALKRCVRYGDLLPELKAEAEAALAAQEKK